jgi:prepilin-type N-terminal cleavage/methylation domain-containing protein
MRKFGSQKGFTVLELLIVITIVGVMAAIATLALSDYWRRSTVKEAARLIDGDLMNIRTTVKSRQQFAIMNITTTGYSAFIDVDNDYIYNAVVDEQILMRTFNAPLQLQGVAPFAVPGNVSFNNLGKIVTNVSLSIRMTTEPTRQYRIDITTTGLTRVFMTADSGTTWTQAW